jgi:pimeloyl-ACP methyl ester carboxylesterase
MTRIASIDEGRGSTAVFLLHGVGGGKEAWPDTVAALVGAGYRAIAWDMPGYGGSDFFEPYSNQGLGEACAELIAGAGASRNVILGHSMGGMVAQEFVALHPGRIDGLILSGTSPAFGKPGGDWQRQFLASRFAPLDAGRGMAGLAPELVAAMIGSGADAAGAEAARRVMSGVPEATYRAALSAIVSFDRRENLGNIDVPTLCIAGEEDRNAMPSVMEKMAERIPGAQYVCLPRIGHIANLEAPAAFNALVLDFLQRHFPN